MVSVVRTSIQLLVIAAALIQPGRCAAGMWAEPPTLKTLIASSDVIVSGTVTQLVAEREPLTGIVVTRVTIRRVVHAKAHAAQDSFTFTMYGGRLGDDEFEIVGQPKLVLSERYILFLTRESKNREPALSSISYNERGLLRVIERGAPALSGVVDCFWRPVLAVEEDGFKYGQSKRHGPKAESRPATKGDLREVTLKRPSDRSDIDGTGALTEEAVISAIRSIAGPQN